MQEFFKPLIRSLRSALDRNIDQIDFLFDWLNVFLDRSIDDRNVSLMYDD